MQKKIKDKSSQIMNLYFKALEQLLLKEEKKTSNPQYHLILENENLHRALIACSIETVSFVNNCTDVSFLKLLQICEIQAFEFWRIIPNFVKFDPKMPSPVQKHFYDLEIKILMHFAWQKGSIIHQIINRYVTQPSNNETSNFTFK